jgi:hypothetical protein
MKLKKVKIAGHSYKIKYKDSLVREHGATGMSSEANCDIILQTGGKRSHRQEIFIHEIVEQINGRFEIGLSHDKITSIAASLFQVLKDNPDLLAGVH